MDQSQSFLHGELKPVTFASVSEQSFSFSLQFFPQKDFLNRKSLPETIH